MSQVIDLDSVLAIFREEVADLGGRVLDETVDEQTLYLRGLLPAETGITDGDDVRAGVALRCIEDEVEVRPYVQRRVCRNGAVVAHSALGSRIALHGVFDADTRLLDVRHAIRAAGTYEAFAEFTDAMRASRAVEADVAVLLMALRRAGGLEESALLELMRRFRSEGASAYALGNAMTSLARDTEDPDLRWRREEIGAAVFARRSTRPRTHASAMPGAAAADRYSR